MKDNHLSLESQDVTSSLAKVVVVVFRTPLRSAPTPSVSWSRSLLALSPRAVEPQLLRHQTLQRPPKKVKARYRRFGGFVRNLTLQRTRRGCTNHWSCISRGGLSRSQKGRHCPGTDREHCCRCLTTPALCSMAGSSSRQLGLREPCSSFRN